MATIQSQNSSLPAATKSGTYASKWADPAFVAPPKGTTKSAPAPASAPPAKKGGIYASKWAHAAPINTTIKGGPAAPASKGSKRSATAPSSARKGGAVSAPASDYSWMVSSILPPPSSSGKGGVIGSRWDPNYVAEPPKPEPAVASGQDTRAPPPEN